MEQKPQCHPDNPVKEEDGPPEEQSHCEDFDDGHYKDDEPAPESLERGGRVAVFGQIEVTVFEICTGFDLAGLQGVQPLPVEVAWFVGLLADCKTVQAFDSREVDEGAQREFAWGPEGDAQVNLGVVLVVVLLREELTDPPVPLEGVVQLVKGRRGGRVELVKVRPTGRACRGRGRCGPDRGWPRCWPARRASTLALCWRGRSPRADSCRRRRSARRGTRAG